MSEAKQTKKYFVSGRVQGVGFRMFVMREAQRLGITGYTRNLFDQRVEVFATGTPAQLEKLKVALQRGPMLASVSSVTEEVAGADESSRSGFEITGDA